MKSQLLENPSEGHFVYPILLIHESKEFVCLFNSPRFGMVVWVSANNNKNCVGHHSEFYVMEEFGAFPHSIQLSND